MQAVSAPTEKAIYQEAWRVSHRLPEFIADRGGRLIWCNAAFLRVVTEGDVVRLQQQMLTFPDRSTHAGFLAFIRDLGAHPAAWLMRPPTEDAYLLFRCTLVEPAGRPDGIACTIYDSRDRAPPVWGDFPGLFGLTPSEGQISRLLMEGVTLVQAAVHLGITAETAKTHLRRIYAKLGVGSREEFYARLLPFRAI